MDRASGLFSFARTPPVLKCRTEQYARCGVPQGGACAEGTAEAGRNMQVHGPTWLGGALAIVTLTVCGCGVETQAAQTPRIVTAAGNGGPDPLRYSWGGCYYRLGTKIPATDLGEKLGSPVSYAMDSVGYDVYTARIPGERHLDRLAFVVGGSAHEGIRAGQLYNPGDAISQAARALENYVSEATFPTRHGTMEGRVAVGGTTPLRTISGHPADKDPDPASVLLRHLSGDVR